MIVRIGGMTVRRAERSDDSEESSDDSEESREE